MQNYESDLDSTDQEYFSLLRRLCSCLHSFLWNDFGYTVRTLGLKVLNLVLVIIILLSSNRFEKRKRFCGSAVIL
jgi:hypothetical protein